MTKKSIFSLAALLVFLGILILGLSACGAGGNLSMLNNQKFKTNTHEIGEAFDTISIKSGTADISLLPSEDDTCRVVCFETARLRHEVTVEDGTHTVKVVDTRKWYHHINFSLESPKLTVYLPKSEYAALTINESTGGVSLASDFCFESIDVTASTGDISILSSAENTLRVKTSTGSISLSGLSAAFVDLRASTGGVSVESISCTNALKIKTSTGSIRAKDLSVGAMELSASTGKITSASVVCAGDMSIRVDTGKTYLADVICKNLTSSGDTGDISLTSVVAKEKISIERDTGDVKLDASDAAELCIVTDTGDIKGTLLSEKIFFYKTDTGDVSLPKTTSGGICDITTDTGDISIEIK